MNVLYVSAFGLKYYTMVVVTLNKNKVLKESFWERALNASETDIDVQKEVYTALYWLNNG